VRLLITGRRGPEIADAARAIGRGTVGVQADVSNLTDLARRRSPRRGVRENSSIQNAAAAAALFADDGIIELPTVNARAQGPVAIQRFLTGLLAKVPDFRFENVRIWIETHDRVFGEYAAQGHVVSTGTLYKQTYAGLLVAEQEKMTLVHEALDTLAASRAFSADGV
jgi:ketosteroid isomerase-like protein